MGTKKRPTKTAAYKVFEANLGRAQAFLRIFRKDAAGGRGQGQPSDDEKELLRGCLVFAVGSLDAYLNDLILEVVTTFGVHSKYLKDAMRDIAKQDPALALRVALSGKEEFEVALSEWLDTKSFQGVQKVTNALGYVGSALTMKDFDTTTGVNTAEELERITKDRHAIVHKGQKPYVRQKLAEEAVTMIGGIAKAIDAEICTRFYP